jgi:hypothetical protein
MTQTATSPLPRQLADVGQTAAGAPAVSAGRVMGRLIGRHSLAVEMVVLVSLYLIYDGSRGLVSSGRSVAIRHAHEVVSLERTLHLQWEASFERLSRDVPGLLALFGFGYAVFHLAVTGTALVWLHRRAHPEAFVVIRSALLMASTVGLIGFVAFPAAPPRLAGVGLVSAAAHGPVNLESGSLQWFYNPYAAMPSLHVAFAALVGFALVRWGPNRYWRAAGVAYPVWVTAEVLATGNHFVLDALIGAAIAAASLIVASTLNRLVPAVRFTFSDLTSADTLVGIR